MNQLSVLKIQSLPLFRKYPGVPKIPENLKAVYMKMYRDKNLDSHYILKRDEKSTARTYQ
jgi:hypothetical protein